MPDQPKSIGKATMKPDGTILLQLRAEGENGTIGDSLLVVSPNDPKHQGIVSHLGGIKPGEEKPVPPFPEPE